MALIQQSFVSQISAAMKQPSGALPIYRQPANVMIELCSRQRALASALCQAGARYQAILPSGDLVQRSLYALRSTLYALRSTLYALLTELGVPPMRGVQRIRAAIMTRIEAELLDCGPGTPMLIVARRCFPADGRPVEFTQTRYHGERNDF